jgi:Mn-dependent DtxR family transcriptional regulator
MICLPSQPRNEPREGERPQFLRRKSAEATEDYLEAINALIDQKGYAASVDIAEQMKVSKPTVTSIVKKLHNEGFLVHERYRGVALTPKGKRLAQEMRRKHELITDFLMLFGVDEKSARQDAERIEHGLYPETIEKIRAFTEYVLSNPDSIGTLKLHFRKKTLHVPDSK